MIAGWKSATTSDITDLLQCRTLIGRDKRFYSSLCSLEELVWGGNYHFTKSFYIS